MKYKRQGQILKIIQEQNIRTHEQLIEELHKTGFDVTQATVSRDIKELGLVKIPLPERRQRVFLVERYTERARQKNKYDYRYGKERRILDE